MIYHDKKFFSESIKPTSSYIIINNEVNSSDGCETITSKSF